ncbi:class I SAM-dependent methyltransferase [Desulfosarcina sp. OttesenSCG-928-G10]|nr:class I SAM-dependent methyltransferase [Desulfosarcina sp. OttesenSCG-928-G10]MDL2321406.1 class I SAM-dependent methyltransferase [Desulfosarcina sp. OttesenSCG-928-B08]
MNNGYDFHPHGNDAPSFPYPETGFPTDSATRLMLDMLAPAAGESLLDIGCGTGPSCALLLERGLEIAGVYAGPDDIPAFLPADSCGKITLCPGNADDLPFDDNSFNHACLMNFPVVGESPQKALEEAFRVAKDRVFIGFLNRYAMAGIRRRVTSLFVWNNRPSPLMFSIWEIKSMIRDLAGPVPVCWRTVGRPVASRLYPVQTAGLFQRFPFGLFVGMVVTLVPRFRTRPLVLSYEPRTLGKTADCASMARLAGKDQGPP